MDRINGVERGTTHKGRRVLDIFHVWPDHHVENDVTHRSWVFIFLAQEPEAGRRVEVTLELPGGRTETRGMAWGEEWYSDVPAWGIASAHAEGDFPLAFFWELTPGKKPG